MKLAVILGALVAALAVAAPAAEDTTQLAPAGKEFVDGILATKPVDDDCYACIHHHIDCINEPGCGGQNNPMCLIRCWIYTIQWRGECFDCAPSFFHHGGHRRDVAVTCDDCKAQYTDCMDLSNSRNADGSPMKGCEDTCNKRACNFDQACKSCGIPNCG